MPRSRNIKPGFFANEHLATLPYETRLLFIGLWTLADREGRLEDRPIRIKMQLFGADAIDIDACLNQLASAGEPFIVRYVVDDVPLIQIVNFVKHQSPHKEEPVKHPAPNESGENLSESRENLSSTRQAANKSRDVAECSKRETVRGNQESANGIQDSAFSIQEPDPEIKLLALDAGKPGNTPDEVFAYFSDSGALTKAKVLTPARRKKLLTRLRQADWPWREAIDKLPIPNDKGFTFQPDLDWLVENDTNARKVAEGRYDRASGGMVSAGTRHNPNDAGFGDGF